MLARAALKSDRDCRMLSQGFRVLDDRRQEPNGMPHGPALTQTQLFNVNLEEILIVSGIGIHHAVDKSGLL